MVVNVICYPEKKVSIETQNKIKRIVQERNLVIAKKLDFKPLDVDVKVYYNIGSVASKVLRTSDNRLGVFVGYIDYENSIYITQPETLEPIFGDNLWKQIYILIDYCLYKYYFCQKYFPRGEPYKLYYKYLSEALAKALSGNINKEYLFYEIKKYNSMVKFKKELELEIIFLIILEKSGTNFIIENIDRFFNDCNIKKSILEIFKKEYSEIVNFFKLELKERDKEIKKV